VLPQPRAGPPGLVPPVAESHVPMHCGYAKSLERRAYPLELAGCSEAQPDCATMPRSRPATHVTQRWLPGVHPKNVTQPAQAGGDNGGFHPEQHRSAREAVRQCGTSRRGRRAQQRQPRVEGMLCAPPQE
jgi:hypothetical protein